jgi:hypothetical protein
MATRKQNEVGRKMPTAQKSTEIRKKLMLSALTETLYDVTSACKIADVPRRTFYNWMNEDEEFKQAVEEIPEIVLDVAEQSLLKKIKGGDTIAIIFYLKTKGKKRGYIEKQEIDNNHKFDTPLIVDWSEQNRTNTETKGSTQDTKE